MKINASEFNAALEGIEASKGITRETVLSALEEALIRGYRKQLGGDDADVRVKIDADNGIIEMWQVKVVKDEVEDDFLEVATEDANELDKSKTYKDGDEFFIPANIEDLRKATAMSIKNIMRQKFSEAEKTILYETFKDKIGTLITGKVEKVDERGISVNLIKTSVYLPHNHLIGDERFNTGDTIKLYVSDVVSDTKGSKIEVTRSSPGFLACVMNEEISDLYNGSVVIKGISREAGERSKVAVYSPDPNIDPAGACIGPNGTKIQKVVSYLGNGQSKEKIDVIAYSDNAGLYIIEALKPARVAGIIFDEETKQATAIVKDDSYSLAIGKKGTNVRLAVKLTGYHIDIKTETEAFEAGLEYQTIESLQAAELERRNRLQMEAAAKKAAEMAAARQKADESNDVLPGLPSGYVAPFERSYEDENSDLTEALEEEIDNNEETYVAPTVEETPVEEPAKEEKPVIDTPKTSVKTTTSIEDLEASLDSDKDSKKTVTKKKSSFKKKDEEEKKDTKGVTDTSSAERMSIYTEEELREIEEEENFDDTIEDDDDVDYDEYDDYYDDDNR